jgi:hypothetical protein
MVAANSARRIDMTPNSPVRNLAKRILSPLRSLANRFVNDPARVDKETMVYKAGFIVSADNVEGDYLEFGVMAGDSFIKAYRSMHQAHLDLTKVTEANNVTAEDVRERGQTWGTRRFFAFDSFEGLPEITGIDKQGTEFKQGKYVCSFDNFTANIRQAGVPAERTACVKGWFNETLTDETRRKHNLQKAAIVFIDSDLYESAKSALNFIKPLLVDGTVIMFDEWYGYRGNPDLGERRAFSEFVADMRGWVFTEFHKEHARRCSFIANRRLTHGSGTII